MASRTPAAAANTSSASGLPSSSGSKKQKQAPSNNNNNNNNNSNNAATATASSSSAAALAPAAPPTTNQLLLESLDISPHPKPFKNPAYKPPVRRNKNLKQILADGANATATATATATANNGVAAATEGTGGGAGGGAGGTGVGGQQMQTTYQNIESPPSFRRGSSKWCDVTGLPARYTDPKTKLRYRNGEVYAAVRSLPPGGAERYLEVRGANVVLK